MSLNPDLPMSQLEVDYDKNPTELYTTICAGEWEAASTIARDSPDQARTWVVRHDPEGGGEILWRFLPLHSACARQPSDTLIEALLEAFPDAAACKDDQGFLPLHYACGNRASDVVVNMLLIVNPQAAKIQDPYGGKLPLHHLSQWGASSAGVINMLLSVYPESVRIQDSGGFTPLELAKAANYPGRNVVITALKRCEIASKMRSQSSGPSDDQNDEGIGMIPDADKDTQALIDQEEKITQLTKELVSLRDETKSLKQKLNDERVESKVSMCQEKQKAQTLKTELESARKTSTELSKIKSKLETRQAKNGEEISKLKRSIDSLEQQKKDAIKERDTLQEKFALKSKTSADTIKKLEETLSLQNSEIDIKQSSNNALTLSIQELEKEIAQLSSENISLTKEIEELEEYKKVSETMDSVSSALMVLRDKYEKIKQISVEQEKTFKEAVVKREQKILEIAQLEEKLRASTSEEHDQLMLELEDQENDIERIIALVR